MTAPFPARRFLAATRLFSNLEFHLMKSPRFIDQPLPRLVIGSLGLLGLSPFVAHADPALPSAPTPAIPPGSLSAASPRVAVPAVEPDGPLSGAGASPFARNAVSPAAGQTLTAPVTVNASTSADALTVTQTSSGRAITGSVTSTSNSLSAIKGITAGTGSGVNGVNSGTGGPAGKFQITASGSKQAGLVSTTAGTGNAVQGVITSTAEVDTPAVLGQHLSGPSYSGIGVEGDGNLIGVKGVSANFYGVSGESKSGTAVYAAASSGTGLYAYSGTGTAAYIYSVDSYGLYATSVHSYAGYFNGTVYATGAITAASYGYTSDRELKQDFAAVDSADVLTRIAAMPITAWDYKARPAERHIGPMAQDFHAAFGLGADDKHIDVVDGIGVSLAAIKELQRRLNEKEALVTTQAGRIDTLESQVAQKSARVDNLESQLQALQAAQAGVDARLAALEQTAATAAMGVARP